MAEQPKKKRDIKDLKARLGKGAPAGQPGPQPGGGMPVPPPLGGSVPPPPSMGQMGGHVPGLPGSIAPPPFARQQSRPPASARDPFASMQAPTQREVRLVIDDSAVADSEVGRKGRSRTATVVLAIGVAIGIGVGFMTAGVRERRTRYNLAVEDGKAIYQSVRDASSMVGRVQQAMREAIEAATPPPNSGRKPKAAYSAIETVGTLKKPFTAGQFSGKNYNLLKSSTVDALFEYYNKVNLLWERLERLAARLRSESVRKEIDQAAQAAEQLATTQYGCVPTQSGDAIACSLVVVNMPTAAGPNAELPTKLDVAPGPGLRGQAKTRYQGQDLSKSPSDFVVLIDTRTSLRILGQQASAFGKYRGDLVEIHQLLEKAVELQGQLERELGEVARLEKVFTF